MPAIRPASLSRTLGRELLNRRRASRGARWVKEDRAGARRVEAALTRRTNRLRNRAARAGRAEDGQAGRITALTSRRRVARLCAVDRAQRTDSRRLVARHTGAE